MFSQAPLLVLDYRWSHNPPTYRRTVTPNWYRTHTVPKFGLLSSWITGACHYTRHIEQSHSKSSPKSLSPICHEKLSEKYLSILFGATHCSFTPLENHVGVYAPSILANKSRLKLANTLNLAKRII